MNQQDNILIGTDKTYADAAMRSIGWAVGEMVLGMIDKGLTREEAIRIGSAYVQALALGSATNKENG